MQRPGLGVAAWLASLASMASLASLAPLPLAAAAAPVQPFVAVTAPLPPRSDAQDLKFRELIRLPIGPRGLELAPGALALAGQRVRLVGYMANQDAGTGAPGVFILAPLPVLLGDEDEALADDLPPTAVHVHMPLSQSARSLLHVGGLLAVTGTLQLGPRGEADGRRSTIRIIQTEADLLPAPAPVNPGKAP